MKINELRMKLAAAVAAARALIQTAIDEDRALTEDEETRLTALESDIDEKEKLIKRAEKMADADRRLDKLTTVPAVGVTADDGPGSGGSTVTVTRDADDTPFEPTRAGFGECMRSIYIAGNRGIVDERLAKVQRKAEARVASGLGEAVPSDGGFVLQDTFVTSIWERAFETGMLPDLCTEFPLGPQSKSVKIPAINETSRVDGSRQGGVRMYWEGEGDALTATKPQFKLLTLELRKLIGGAYCTEEMMEDAPFIGAWLERAFGREAGFKLDDGIINGNGAPVMLGVLNSPALITVTKETGQAAATLLAMNIWKMWSRMPASSRRTAVWAINQDIEPQLYSMSLTIGTGGVPVFLPPGGLSQAPYSTLLTRPVMPLEQCQTLGTLGDIILFDPQEYAIVRKAPRAAWSAHVRFLQDEQTFKLVLRIEGQPLWSSAITPFKGSNSLSPFIALQTRS